MISKAWLLALALGGAALALALSLRSSASAARESPPGLELPRRPVATYSIVARDPKTGDLGVAVQSHWFSVGSVVPWAESGVGAVATQSFVKVSYGPQGLALMRLGKSAPDTLASLLAQDDAREVRQVAMVDASGRVATHTGARCIQAAGHHGGAGYSVQANLMENDTVWPAMAKAFESAEGELAERMLAALEAAQREGGDIRGRQSAAMLVVRAKSSGHPWDDRLVDLRVEDHPDPLGELARLLKLAHAYDHMNQGDLRVEKGDVDGAMREYSAARELAPACYEMSFWAGITMASAGRLEEAVPLVQRSFEGEPRLRKLVPRLPAAGLLPDKPEVIERLTSGK
jgi:uncharacterized Ntn-hydrolase superfamily protein